MQLILSDHQTFMINEKLLRQIFITQNQILSNLL